MAFRYLLLPLCCLLPLLLPNEVLRTFSVNAARVKRAASSVQDLAVELAKARLLKMMVNEHADLEKAKESVYIPQKVFVADSCTTIKSVGEPITHNARRYDIGVWMKDPLGSMGTETIFVMQYYHGKNVVEEFENMEMFKEGTTRKTYILPYNWDGTGAVVYGQYLYYNRETSNYIYKYSLRTERVEAIITLSSFTPRKNYYESGGYSGMDLAVDEQGLWVLWGSTANNRKLHASKIDVYENVITQTLTLNTEPMSSMGNAFVACGVIYCIDDSNDRYTTINFAYDTKTERQWNPNIPFTNQYGYNYMVDYNPREKVLYAWNNRRQVTYSLTFEEH